MWYQCTLNIEWLTLKGLTIPNVEWKANPVEPLYTAGGNTKWYNQFGSLVVSLKIKHINTFAIQVGKPLLDIWF